MSDQRVDIPIDPDLLLGIVTDALEGGMSDWAQVWTYDWTRWYENGRDFGAPKEEVKGDYVLLRIRDTGAEEEKWVDLTYDLMEQSIQWALIHYNRWLPFQAADGVIAEIDYDAVGADICLQRAVIGEVIYG